MEPGLSLYHILIILGLLLAMKILHVAFLKDTGINGIKSVLEELIPEQIKLGNEVVLYNIFNPLKGYIERIKEFRTIVESFKPDVVIFHSLYRSLYFIYGSYLSSKRIPFLIEPHGGTSYANSKKNPLVKKIANLLCVNRFIRQAKAIIYLNKGEEDQCVFSKIRKGSLVIPNGISIDEKVQSLPHEIKDRTIIVYFSAIRTHQKGLDYLLPAIKLFSERKDGGKAEFHFYGSAETEEDLNLMQSYVDCCKDHIFYHGLISGKEKKEVLYNSDIFILTSRYEGMPMAVLEALSQGTPCILTPQTNMADFIKQTESGWVTALNVDAISETIEFAVNDYLQRHEVLRKNAFMSIKDYNWSKIAVDSIAAYKSSIGLI